MHVLTGGDMSGHHEPLPAVGHSLISASSEMSHQMSPQGQPRQPVDVEASGATTATPTGAGRGMVDDSMAACILFLVVGGAAAVLALLASRRRLPVDADLVRRGAPRMGVMRRGPPGRDRPRIALCISRI